MLKRLLSTYGFVGLTALLASCDNNNHSPNESPISESPVIEPAVNTPPTVSEINIIDINGDEIAVGDVLEGQYRYIDRDGDLEGDSIYQWYRGIDTETQDEVSPNRGSFILIEGATSKTYTVTAEDFGLQLMMEVTPVAQTGELLGEVVTLEPTPFALDIMPPVISLVGDTPMIIVQGGTYTDQGATTTDDVDGAGNAIASGVVDTSNVGSYTITYTATDTAGNKAEDVVRVVNVTAIPDTTAPVITLVGDSTVRVVKGDIYTELGATTIDNVDGEGSATVMGVVNTNAVGSYTITYTATDAAGNEAVVVTRTVNVVAAPVVEVPDTETPDTEVPDIEAPVIRLIGANSIEVIQGGTYTELGATTADNVDANGSAVVSGTVNTDEIGSYTITYNSTDAAGNAAVAVTRTVNVVAAPDTEAPVITLKGDSTIEVIQGETYTELGATTSDNIDENGSAIVSGTVNTAELGSYTITYSATDEAGNEAVAVTRTVNVVAAPDTEAPVITLIGESTVEVIQGETYTEQGATTSDNVDENGIAVVSGSVNIAEIGSYTITYSATDAAGNEAAAVTRTVNVVAAPDTEAPVITLIGENTIEVIQGEDYTEQGATTSDNVDENGSAVVSGTVNTAEIGSYTITYTATDAAGNEAVEVTRTVNVVAAPDTEAPVITLNGDSTVEVIQGEAYTEQGATTSDNIDENGSAIVSGTVNTAEIGSYTITYSTTDAAGNEAVAVTRTVNVVAAPDTEVPVITLIGENTVEVIQGEAYTEQGATTSDNVDEKGSAVVSGTVNTDEIGSYTITYSATDAAGNEAVAVTRMVNVVAAPDTEVPVITLIGESTVEVIQGEAYTEQGATTSDNVDENGSAVVSGTVNTDEIGSYTITYSATDAAGNEAVAVTRTVNVVAAPDTEVPVITLIGESTVEVIQGEAYTEQGATTSDNVDENGSAIVSGTVNTDEAGSYTITYSATDAAGNEATPVTRTVNVVAIEATLQSAHRLLLQATFGPTLDSLNDVQTTGIIEWIDAQLNMPSAYDSDTDNHRTHLERLIEIALHAEPNADWFGEGSFNKATYSGTVDEYQMAAWWENALGLHPTNTLHGSDQLRQRVAYALSQLLVTSNFEPPLDKRGEGLAYYYDILAKHAFGNYRDLLGEMARSPTMGVYLSHQGNKKASLTDGTRPDENFARELMQLFTIGLYELNRDGTGNRDGDPNTYPDVGTNLVPTYTQNDTEELAKVMTGWDLVDNRLYGISGKPQGDYTQQMEFTPSMHEDEIEEGGDGFVTVLGTSFALNAADADGKNTGMDAALDVLFNHPNVGPYVSKHLIMRLVTSNPSSGYVDRVASVFNNDGTGVRGNLKAVVRAILVDIEARSDEIAATESFGKFKEPLLAWTQLLRATDAMPLNGWLSRDGSTRVSDVFWLTTPQKYFGQGPMRSPSVFNFYNADYVPSDTAFSSKGLVAPEFQVQTDQIFLEYNNQINSQVFNYEKNTITVVDETDLATFASKKQFGSNSLILINFDKELAIIEDILGGDFDNIENTDTDGVAFREKVADALIAHLNKLMLGGTMTVKYKAALKELLLKSNAAKNGDNFTEAVSVVQIMVRLIASSSAYMVQK